MNNLKLHAVAKSLGRQVGEAEGDLIATLILVQEREAYRDFDYKGLVTYGIKHIGLTAAVAKIYQTVVNHAIKLPRLKKALESRELSVAYASRIVSSLTAENIEEVLSYAADHSVEQTQRWMVKEKGAIRNVSLTISTETRELLREVRDIAPGHLSVDELLMRVLHEYKKRHDPIEKAKRAQRKPSKKSESRVPGDDVKSAEKNSTYSHRQALTAAQKHAINLRDECRCTFIEANGERCCRKSHLHKHHVVKVHEGGSNDPDNVLTLCYEHHDLVHQLSFPIEIQQAWFSTGGSQKSLNVQ